MQVLPVGADGLGLRSGCDEMSELRRDALERDEKRLAELGRRTVEMYALAHIFTERLEVSTRQCQHATANKHCTIMAVGIGLDADIGVQRPRLCIWILRMWRVLACKRFVRWPAAGHGLAI